MILSSAGPLPKSVLVKVRKAMVLGHIRQRIVYLGDVMRADSLTQIHKLFKESSWHFSRVSFGVPIRETYTRSASGKQYEVTIVYGPRGGGLPRARRL